jgi:hypothetical protein
MMEIVNVAIQMGGAREGQSLFRKYNFSSLVIYL